MAGATLKVGDTFTDPRLFDGALMVVVAQLGSGEKPAPLLKPRAFVAKPLTPRGPARRPK